MKVRNEDGADEGQTVEVTVYDYFTKHRKLEFTTSAYMPCVDVGRPKKPNYIPLEVSTMLVLSGHVQCYLSFLSLMLLLVCISALFACATATLYKVFIYYAKIFFS